MRHVDIIRATGDGEWGGVGGEVGKGTCCGSAACYRVTGRHLVRWPTAPGWMTKPCVDPCVVAPDASETAAEEDNLRRAVNGQPGHRAGGM